MKNVNLNSDEIYVLGKLLEVEISATSFEIKNYKSKHRGASLEDMKRYRVVLEGLQEKLNS